VSRQLEHYFIGLQGFSEGVSFVYPVSTLCRPTKTLAFTPADLTEALLAGKIINRKSPAGIQSVDFTRDVISSLLVNLKCLDKNG
jgi:hypothetical protein